MLELLFVVAQKSEQWYTKNEKGTTAHKVGCPIGKDGNSAPIARPKCKGGFSMLELLFVVQGYDERK